MISGGLFLRSYSQQTQNSMSSALTVFVVIFIGHVFLNLTTTVVMTLIV